MRCLEYMQITEILRLKEMGSLTYRDIASSVGCSKTTVGDIIKRCKECSLTYDDAVSMTADRINELIYPDAFGPKQVKDEPDWESIHDQLQKNRRLNLQFIWTEQYRPNNPDGYSYSRFCAKYAAWKDATGKHVVMPQEREPGKELFIDWIGDTLNIVIDRETGEIHKAHFFVTTLGDSSYPFVEAFPDETQLNWNQGHLDALKWYGGVPRIFVPDNTKTAVIHTNLYNPEINHAYRELARHYGVAIVPARIIKPRDKPSVESGVGWLETWLLEWLKPRIYFSFEALNLDIRERISELADRKFKKREGSRRSIFEALDKPALREFPKDDFESFKTRFVNHVPNNYHLECEGFYYSVPHSYYHQQVVMHIFAKKIEVFNSNHELIAMHQRHFSGRRYVTISEHMPENHRAVADFRSRDSRYYRHMAQDIGPNTSNFINTLLEYVDFEEQAYKSCDAVINAVQKYGNTRVERACIKAIMLNSVTYSTFKNILKNGQDIQEPTHDPDAETPTPYHENLRVGEWV